MPPTATEERKTHASASRNSNKRPSGSGSPLSGARRSHARPRSGRRQPRLLRIAAPRAASAGDHGRSGAHPCALYACAVPSAHRRRLPELRQQRPLPALGARRGQSAEDAAGEARRAAAGADDLVHPVRARHLEPEDPEGAGPLCDARLQDAERRAAKAGRLLARPGTAQRNGAARRASQQLADTWSNAVR